MMTSPFRTTICLAILPLLLAKAAAADGVADCERYGLTFFKRHGADITKIKIENGDSLEIDRYDDKVGSQFVSTEYIGFAQVTSPSGAKRQRFICLHEGDGKRPVYFGLIAE